MNDKKCFVQDVAGGQSVWICTLIKYITRVTACNIHIKDNIYQTQKLNPSSTVNLKTPFIMPLTKAGKSTEWISADTERM